MHAPDSLLPPPTPASLDVLPIGSHGRVIAILGGHHLQRRLLGLGLRVGSEINLLHRRGRGVVIVSTGNRIALGGGIAQKLLIETHPG